MYLVKIHYVYNYVNYREFGKQDFMCTHIGAPPIRVGRSALTPTRRPADRAGRVGPEEVTPPADLMCDSVACRPRLGAASESFSTLAPE